MSIIFPAMIGSGRHVFFSPAVAYAVTGAATGAAIRQRWLISVSACLLSLCGALNLNAAEPVVTNTTQQVPAASADSVANRTWSNQQRLLYYSIPVQVRFTPENAQLEEKIWAYLEGIDGIFNDYRDDTEIGKINKSGPGTYTLSPTLAEAFALAVTMNRITGGAFDITVGPLRRLYKQAREDGRFPTAEKIAEAKKYVGPHTFSLNDNVLTVHQANVTFDFGGLIKGMAVDYVIAQLKANGATAALVQCGGETGCYGLSMRGAFHKIGIPYPLDEQEDWCVIADRGTGFSGSTSGNYRLPIIIDGQEYYHVFDPLTGKPAALQVLSASLVFPANGHNGQADGLAKLGVLDPERFLRVVVEQGAQGMVLIKKSDGTVEERHSPGWPAFVHENYGMPKPIVISPPAGQQP
jgi:FAD:protein FMN transferase